MKKTIIALVIVTLFIGISISPLSDGLILRNQSENEITKNKTISETVFDNYVNFWMRFAHKPSISSCIIINDSVVWSNAYGVYDIENNKLATTDILYLTASISKTVTATALMQLYDQDLFDLDEDVNNFLPFSLRNPNHPDKPITFRMILSHRSSLADDNLYWLCLSYIPGDPDILDYPYPWLREYLLPNGSAYSPNVWSDSEPGEKLRYANIGYSIIGYLVEIISGQQFDQYCKDHIFTPLMMYNTSFRLDDINISNVAVPYEYKNREYVPHPHYGMRIVYPSATMRTSVEEYSHFIIAFMNGGKYKNVRILNETTVELMHTTHYPSDLSWNYGLGWIIKNKIFRVDEIGHSGGWPGVHTLATIQPEKDLAVIVFTNCLGSELGMTINEQIAFKFIINALFFKANKLAS
jgi:CubicO group peptidase (beta-lactamase class C family)